MRVKRYVVDSMPDALQKIRVDLGNDAVIINTKEIRAGGFMGMFAKKKIEVIAAIDTPSGPSGSQAASKTVPGAGGMQQKTLVTASAAASPIKQAAAAAYGGQMKEKQTLAFPEVPDVLPPEETNAAPVPKVPLQFTQAAATAVNAREDKLLEELKQMKEMMHKLSLRQAAPDRLDPVLQQFEQRMLEQEVEPWLVSELIQGITEEAENESIELTEAFVKESLEQQMLDILRPAEEKTIQSDTRIVHFVGPTGVGKTTTIAKLAAEQVLKAGRKVGFITSDTYRIAAVEQLKTYATILNVPLEVVFSPLDLTKAFEQLKECDLIFMDTAGRNFRNEMYVSELNALLRSSGKSETYLVLSLTTKYKDMKAITNNFSKFKLHKVLFTKMDETDSYGSILNLIREFGIQTSYIANGQSVPDDIQMLQEQHIIELILGDGNHEE